jgi:hypothetical protein
VLFFIFVGIAILAWIGTKVLEARERGKTDGRLRRLEDGSHSKSGTEFPKE